MSGRNNQIAKFIYISIAFFGVLFVILFLFDSVIIPAVVHSSDTIKVPNIVGKSLSEAESILSSHDLKPNKIGEQYNLSMPGGYVINQSPKADAVVKVGRSINFLISKGGEKMIMPYLIGQNLRQAKVMLMQKGLIIGNITYEAHDSIGTDTILHQSFQPGRDIAYGTVVDITVSRGSALSVKVPILTGRTLTEAEVLLQESGLKVGSITATKEDNIYSGTFVKNTIVDQSPKAGETVQNQSTVNLIIYK